MTTTEVAVYLATGHVDLRGAFDRLAAVTRGVLRMDPNSGALFIFRNRSGNRLKCLWWDRNGYVILYKRLARGSFPLPDTKKINTPSIQITRGEFASILAAVGVTAVRNLH